MNSLVADYGTDSSSSSEEDETKIEERMEEKLPSASSLMNKSNDSSSDNSKYSVFTNPFLEAEAAQKSILEKHVKMTVPLEHASTVNNKQICWNFRKGKCRFGHKCKFLHDDIIKKPLLEDNNTQPFQDSNLNKVENPLKRKKNKAGLPLGLTPSKKFMKTYKSS